MSRPTKYVKGEAFASMNDLCEWLEAGGWVYMGRKVQHPGWVVSSQFRMLWNWLKSGQLFRAEERAALEEEARQIDSNAAAVPV